MSAGIAFAGTSEEREIWRGKAKHFRGLGRSQGANTRVWPSGAPARRPGTGRAPGWELIPGKGEIQFPEGRRGRWWDKAETLNPTNAAPAALALPVKWQ